jgi:hypothetical protein
MATVAHDPDGTPFTAADLAAHVERVERALAGAGMPEVLALLQRINAAAERVGLGAARIPFGLIGEPLDGGHDVLEVRPHVSCQPEHLVLTAETARGFDLVDFKVGKNSQFGGPECLPLDTFSVDAYARAGDRLSSVQAWHGTDVCYPGMSISLYVHALRRGPLQFRGLLWCRVRWSP